MSRPLKIPGVSRRRGNTLTSFWEWFNSGKRLSAVLRARLKVSEVQAKRSSPLKCLSRVENTKGRFTYATKALLGSPSSTAVLGRRRDVMTSDIPCCLKVVTFKRTLCSPLSKTQISALQLSADA